MNYNQLEKDGYSVFSSAINPELIKECLNLETTQAGIANGHIDTNIRGDKTCWLSPESGNHISKYMENATNIQAELNKRFFLGLKEFECHFSLFEPGSSFKRHLDNKNGSNRRKITYITYLNENWEYEDGGLLAIINGPTILPRLGTSIIFDSNTIEHEVTLARKPRMAISGWFT